MTNAPSGESSSTSKLEHREPLRTTNHCHSVTRSGCAAVRKGRACGPRGVLVITNGVSRPTLYPIPGDGNR